jgi:hypothetical protein
MYSVATGDSDEFEQRVYEDIESASTEVPMSPSRVKPLKPAFSHGDINQLTYEEPVFELDPNDNYHVLEDNGSLENSLDKEGKKEEWYDDMGIDDTVVYKMNKQPPPVWRPETEAILAPPLPPCRRAVSSEPEEALKIVAAREPRGGGGRPVPPPKPRSSLDVAFSPGKDMFGIKDNPKFKQKLHEKRQELYGDCRQRSMSMGEGEDLTQENYETVLYTSDDLDVPKLPPRTIAPHGNGLFTRKVNSGNGATKLCLSQTSPRHDLTSPTSPPPLPSRELLDPTLPSFVAPPTIQQAEMPPPVPVRDTSKTRPPLPYIRVGSSEKRRRSLPTSPNPKVVDRSKPLPLPTDTQQPPVAHLRDARGNTKGKSQSAHIQERALPPTPPELDRRLLPHPLPGPTRKVGGKAKLPVTPHQASGAVDSPEGLMYDDILPSKHLSNSLNDVSNSNDPSSPPPPVQKRVTANPLSIPPKRDIAVPKSGSTSIQLPGASHSRQNSSEMLPQQQGFVGEVSPMRQLTSELSSQQQILKGQRREASPMRQHELSPQQRLPKEVSPMRQLANELSSQQRLSKDQQREVSPMRQQWMSKDQPNSKPLPQRRGEGKNPPLPPSKPSVGQGQGSDVKPKPQVLKKPPPPPKKPDITAKKPPPPVSRKPKLVRMAGTSPPSANPPLPPTTRGSPPSANPPLPPTTRGSPPSANPPPPLPPTTRGSPSANPPLPPTMREKPMPPLESPTIKQNTSPARTSLPPQTVGHRPKPVVPKKPIIPLCS